VKRRTFPKKKDIKESGSTPLKTSGGACTPLEDKWQPRDGEEDFFEGSRDLVPDSGEKTPCIKKIHTQTGDKYQR